MGAGYGHTTGTDYNPHAPAEQKSMGQKIKEHIPGAHHTVVCCTLSRRGKWTVQQDVLPQQM